MDQIVYYASGTGMPSRYIQQLCDQVQPSILSNSTPWEALNPVNLVQYAGTGLVLGQWLQHQGYTGPALTYCGVFTKNFTNININS